MPEEKTRADVLQECLHESMRRNGDPFTRGELRSAQMSGPSPETQQALTERELELLHQQLDILEKKVNSLSKDRDSALRWGILALGTAVVGMGSWIFNLLTTKLH